MALTTIPSELSSVSGISDSSTSTAITINSSQEVTFAGNITTGSNTISGVLSSVTGSLGSAATATTQAASDNTTKIATTAYVTTALANMVDSAPSTLDTLNELAAALGDDANFSTTVTNSIATKLPLAGGTMTGALTTTGLTVNSGASNVATTFKSTDATVGIKLEDDTGNVELSALGNVFSVQPAGGTAILSASSTGVRIGGTTSSLPSSGTPGLEVAGSGFSGMAAISRFDNNAYGPALFLVKSRASNASGHTIVADNDDLGSISWTPDDGTNRDTYAAQISAKVDGTPGANDMPTRLEFSTTADGAASPTTRMTISSIGNITQTFSDGSNVTAGNMPSVTGYTLTNTTNSNGSGAKLEFSLNNGSAKAAIAAEQSATTSSSLNFYTENSGTFAEAMRISSSGDLIVAANATGAALIKGVSGDQTSRNSGGYPQFTFVGNEGTGIRRPSANVLAFDTGGDEAMRIDSSGNLALMTDGAEFQLYYTEPRKFISNSGPAVTIKQIDNHATNAYIDFAAWDNSSLMRLTNSGNLLVGTTSSGQPNENYFQARDASGFQVAVGHSNTVSNGQPYFYMTFAGVAIGSITQATASSVAFNTSSDQRLKHNITDAEDAGELIDAIQVRQFDWKVDGEHQRYGMVAQELTTVAPEAVSAPEDPEEMMGVDYSKLVPMLIKEIQTLRSRVQQLENN